MRLSEPTLAGLRETATEVLGKGPAARVLLFGSRADPLERGGDIDLLVEIDGLVPDVGGLGRRFRTALQRRIGERKIDLLIVTPETPITDFIELAREGGIPLWVHDGKS